MAAAGYAVLAAPGRFCSPWIGKTQFWGRARGPLSIVTAQSYPIGPRWSLSTAYWFIDSGMDGNFGRATGPGKPPRRHGANPAGSRPPAPENRARRRAAATDARPSLVYASQESANRRSRGQWHRFSPKSALITCDSPPPLCVVDYDDVRANADFNRGFPRCCSDLRVYVELGDTRVAYPRHHGNSSQTDRTLLRFPLKLKLLREGVGTTTCNEAVCMYIYKVIQGDSRDTLE